MRRSQTLTSLLEYGARHIDAYRPLSLLGPGGWRMALGYLEGHARELGIGGIRVAGEGGLGWVFRAEQPALGRQVAVKVGKRMRGVDLEGALREQGVATARLRHESVPQVHGVGRLGKDGPAYLMLEWVEACTLEDRMREAESLSVRALVQLSIDIADALEHGHGRGVVHGDVQPANILVPRDPARGGVLVDWGGRGGERSVVQGSVGFLSPERARRVGQAAEPEDDVWALALTLAKATSAASLEGSPWTESSAQSSWPQRSSTEPGEASVPSALDAVLARALSPDPRERLSDPARLAAALRACLPRARAADRFHGSRDGG